MEEEYYTCQFCQTQFIPKRRKVTKFCSASCRVKNHYHKNSIKLETKTNSNKQEFDQTEILERIDELKKQLNEKTKIEQVSLAGVGNAAGGALVVESAKWVKKAIQPEKNKPATKGDLEELKDIFNNQVNQVHNVRPDQYGRLPFFDMTISKIVFYDQNTDQFVLPEYDL